MPIQFIQSMSIVIVMSMFSCAEKEKKGTSGSVTVKFAKKESAALTDATEGWVAGTDLEVLQIKPIAVGVSADLNSNSYMIWGSKNCPGAKHEAKISDKKYDYFVYEGGICAANDNDDYLDMLDADALNATLNSRAYPVPPGTYHYVKLVFCSDSKADGVNNLKFRAPGMPENHEVEFCDPFTGYASSGVTISEGGSLEIMLTYDLDKLIDYLEHPADMPPFEPGPANHGCYWTPDGMTQYQYCPKFGQGALVPSINEE